VHTIKNSLVVFIFVPMTINFYKAMILNPFFLKIVDSLK